MCNLFYFLVQGPNLDLVFPDRDQPCPPIVIHFPFFNVFGYAKYLFSFGMQDLHCGISAVEGGILVP